MLSGFRGLLCGRAAFLLLPNLIQDAGQAGNRRQESTENLSDQSGLAGQLTEAIELVDGQHGAFHDTALNGQDVLVLLGKLAYDTSGGNGVASGRSHSGVPFRTLLKS